MHTLKNTIQFKDWKQAMNCVRVIHRLPQKWNADIQKNINSISDKINTKIYEDTDGTINIRLTKIFTESYGECMATHIPSVEDMFKTEYAEAFKKLFI
tara:strand:- start:407 stop:700 length:294 start_codon:yes stop_codon:yes gene_type:complete